jgi:hypothetical protein
MRDLTLDDLRLVIRNLLNERKADLTLSGTGQVYAKTLTARLKDIEALPEAWVGGRPLVQELGETDKRHDGLGEAIYYFTEAILAHPLLSPALKHSAERVRQSFVPKLSVLRESYASEAAAAAKNRPELKNLENDLKALTVPGGTLLDWATAFVDHGDQLDKLLNDRSLTATGGLPAQALQLRTTTIGILSRFRAALTDEVNEDPSLPRDHVGKLFSYVDQLQEMRAQANSKAPKGEDGKGAKAPKEEAAKAEGAKPEAAKEEPVKAAAPQEG